MQFKSFLLRFKTVKRIYAIKRLQSVAIWRNDTIGKYRCRIFEVYDSVLLISC